MPFRFDFASRGFLFRFCFKPRNIGYQFHIAVTVSFLRSRFGTGHNDQAFGAKRFKACNEVVAARHRLETQRGQNGRNEISGITVMKTNKGSAVLSALLYAQVLFGVAAISAVLLREPAPTAVDRMAVASISNSQPAESR